MISPFKRIKTFMNTPDEWHTTVIGIGEGFCPWQPRYEPGEDVENMIKKEYHYYIFGTAVGFACLIFALAGAVALVLRAIL